MQIDSIPRDNLIRVKRNESVSHIFDVELCRTEELAQYDSVDVHLVLYPYSRRISAQEFNIYPFTDYAKDVTSRHRSAYTPIADQANKIFGLVLALMLALFCLLVNPELLTQVEALVGILGAYFLGKDFWGDIETQLIDLTANWRLSYRERYYFYRLEKNSTMIRYSSFAKRHRYGYARLLPEMLDFISQSNSETVRMYFSGASIRALSGSKANICSIHFNPAILEDLEKWGFMFGVKMSFNQELGPHTKRMELFQSLSKNECGCIDPSNEWRPGAAFYREVVTLGPLRHLLKDGLLDGSCLVEWSGKKN